MTSLDQLKKAQFVMNEIVNGFFIADQRLALLMPLLEDKNLFSAWDGTPGVAAVTALRYSLYSSILLDVRAILFDTDDRAVNLEYVINGLKNDDFVAMLKTEFCKPPAVQFSGKNKQLMEADEKQIIDAYFAEKAKTFDDLLPHITRSFQHLKQSELASRIVSARNQMIAHRQIKTLEGERKLYNPQDFGLTWGDAQEIVRMSKQLIFDTNLLINNSSHAVGDFLSHHKEIANSFWSVIPRVE